MNQTEIQNHDARALANYRKGNLLILLATAVVIFVSAKSLRAQTYTNIYWDPNGATSGIGGTGTLSTTSTTWTLNSAGTSTPFAVPSGSSPTTGNSGTYIFNFSGTAGAVTESSSFTVGGINFLTTGYIMTNTAVRTWTADSTNSTGVYITNNANVILTGAGWTLASLNMSGGSGATVTLSNSSTTTANLVMFGTSASTGGKTNSVNTVILGSGTNILGSSSSSGFTQSGNITNSSTGLFVITNGSSSGTVTISGSIDNSGTMIITNAGSGGILNTSGSITNNSGTLSLFSASSVGMTNSGNLTNKAGASFALNNSAGGTVTHSGSIGNSGSLFVTNSGSGNTVLSGSISGAGSVTLNNSAGGKLILSASNTYSAGTTISSLNSGGYIGISDASALGTGTVTVSGAGTNYLRAVGNNLNITNAFAINAGSVLRLAATNTGHRSQWSGVISGAGAVYYEYSDVGLVLSGTNSSFGGGVSVMSSGALIGSKFGMAGNNSSFGTNGVITFGSASGSSGAGTLTWLGTSNETSDKTIALTTASTAGSAGLRIYAGDTSTNYVSGNNVTLTLNGDINSTGINNKTITLGAFNANTLILNGLINQTAGYTNSVVVGVTSNSGTVVLGNTNNSFGGAVTVNGGSSSTNILQVARIGNAGGNSSLGTNGTINIGGSGSTGLNILKYTGSGETSDKVINFAGTTGGATLDQSGSGNLKFTSATTATGSGVKSLTLQGSTAGTGEFAGVIGDETTNAVSLFKEGTGTWTLSGNNTYTGGTTVNGGTLITSGSERLANAGNVSINAGTLRLGGNETVANMTGASGATLDLQSFTLTIGGSTNGATNTALTIGTGAIVKNGTNLIYLNNANNTYSGGFTLNGGEVAYTSSGNYGTGGITNTVFGTGTLTLNGGILRSSSDTSGRNIANNIVLNGDMQFGAAGSAAGITVTNLAGGSTTLSKDVTISGYAALTWKQAIDGSAYRITYNAPNYYNSSNNLNIFSLEASNNIAGLSVNAGTVGYKNRNAFGSGDLILADGVTVGQYGSINNPNQSGNSQLDRSLVNNIQVNGNVKFGLGNYANYLGGNIDLKGANRTFTLGNTTHLYGQVSNGGLVVDNGNVDGTDRTLGLYASNNYAGGTVVRTNAALAVANDKALGSGNLVYTNTSSSAGYATLRASTLSTAANQVRTIANDIGISTNMTLKLNAVTTAQDGAGADVAVNVDTVLSGQISGQGGVTKEAANQVTLTGNNTYTGATTVAAGKLVVNGSIANSTTTVQSGATLGGSGTVGALEIASGGTLAPGNSPGTLTAASAIWNGGGHYAWEINNFLGSAGTNYDFLNVTGALTISANTDNKFIIDVISLLAADNTAGNASNFDAYSSYSFAIATAAGGISGFDAAYFDIMTAGFSNSMGSPGATGSWSIAQNGNSINLNYAAAIPEPTTGSLLLVGLLGALAARRRRS